MAGSALEDPEISRVVIVDLTNCRPAPTSAPTTAGGRHDLCEAVVLDAELFASRPGLWVLQVGWHPDSDAHLAILTSGALGLAVLCRLAAVRRCACAWRRPGPWAVYLNRTAVLHQNNCTSSPVLTSSADNVWRLYNTQRADLAEQTFELQLRRRRGLGLGGRVGGGASRAVTAFAFGPPEGWQRFTVYFLTADGGVWSLCPVVPFGE